MPLELQNTMTEIRYTCGCLTSLVSHSFSTLDCVIVIMLCAWVGIGWMMKSHDFVEMDMGFGEIDRVRAYVLLNKPVEKGLKMGKYAGISKCEIIYSES